MCLLLVTNEFRNHFPSKYYSKLYDDFIVDFSNNGCVGLANSANDIECDITHYFTANTALEKTKKKIILCEYIQQGGIVIFNGTRYNDVWKLLVVLANLPEST